jgi:hypothetical protein
MKAMIEGTLSGCRRTAEIMIATHAAMEGYTPVDVHEEIKDGRYKAVWDSPSGKMQIAYSPTDNDASPLLVTAEDLQKFREQRVRIEALSSQIANG